MGKTRRGGILLRWSDYIKKTRRLAPDADEGAVAAAAAAVAEVAELQAQEEPARQAAALGEADREMMAGTRVWVDGRGHGA